ncbi:MAG: hypothetical protein JNJ88_07030 [Planctomycetes bacterium]|nr:hypothetical protein [Planctomycetota bacterium]
MPEPIELKHRSEIPPSDHAVWLFAFLATAAFAGLWWWAAERDGSARQFPVWDAATYHWQAHHSLQLMKARGLAGFLEAWTSTSGTNTPLVPTSSAILMLLFGERRIVAESVLLAFTFVLLVSTARAIAWLYPRAKGARWTGYATALAWMSFPAVLGNSRFYMFEFPLAAIVALTTWAMLASQGFTRWIPTLAAGAAAGLASVTRAGGPLLLVGPAAVIAAAALRRPTRMRALAGMLAATCIAGAVAATWYARNLRDLLDYVSSVTYGSRASVYAGAGSGLSWENVHYALYWNSLTGPGIPMLVLGFCGLLIQVFERRSQLRSLWSWPVAGALMAYLLGCFLLLFVSQRCQATLHIPLMGFVAFAIVRGIASIGAIAVKRIASVALAVAVLHPIIALTFLVSPNPKDPPDIGPFRTTLPLWIHSTAYSDSLRGTGFDIRNDFKLPLILRAINSLHLPASSGIMLLANHPVLHPYNIRAECGRRGMGLYIETIPLQPLASIQANQTLLRSRICRFDLILAVRPSPNQKADPYESGTRVLLEESDGARFPIFVEAAPPIPLDDGGRVELLRFCPQIEELSAEAEGSEDCATLLVPGAPPDRELFAVIEKFAFGSGSFGETLMIDLRGRFRGRWTPVLLLHVVESNGTTVCEYLKVPAANLSPQESSNAPRRIRVATPAATLVAALRADPRRRLRLAALLPQIPRDAGNRSHPPLVVEGTPMKISKSRLPLEKNELSMFLLRGADLAPASTSPASPSHR